MLLLVLCLFVCVVHLEKGSVLIQSRDSSNNITGELNWFWLVEMHLQTARTNSHPHNHRSAIIIITIRPQPLVTDRPLRLQSYPAHRHRPRRPTATSSLRAQSRRCASRSCSSASKSRRKGKPDGRLGCWLPRCSSFFFFVGRTRSFIHHAFFVIGSVLFCSVVDCQ